MPLREAAGGIEWCLKDLMECRPPPPMFCHMAKHALIGIFERKKSAGKGLYGAVKNVKERVFADVVLPFVNNI